MRQIDELEALREMRDLLLPPQNWIQTEYARRVRTDPDTHTSGEAAGATCWCLAGAAQRVYQTLTVERTSTYRRLERLARAKGYRSVPNFNDTTNHVKVLALLDEAIAEVIAERTAV